MEPFLKWAGGKRWLIDYGKNMLPERNGFNRYFEPFLGGGAIFFHLEPTVGFLSDKNGDLINCYNAIKNDWRSFRGELSRFQKLHNKTFYYKVRSSKPRSPLQRAVRFTYLNRTCWNGLYRVNLKGQFNVPIGTKSTVLFEDDDFERISTLLQRVNISECDFEETIDQAGAGDFVFVDPPYTVKHNLNGFIKYNETLFSWQDQIRLRDSVSRAKVEIPFK